MTRFGQGDRSLCGHIVLLLGMMAALFGIVGCGAKESPAPINARSNAAAPPQDVSGLPPQAQAAIANSRAHARPAANPTRP